MSEVDPVLVESFGLDFAKRHKWLKDLGSFLVEASQHTWAADAPELGYPERLGFKELYYAQDGWEYRDSYSGYFSAPGSSTVYYRGRPAWYMSYGGEGQHPEHYDRAQETYSFLRKVLRSPDSVFPVRGPLGPISDPETRMHYSFHHTGNLENGKWQEHIWDNAIPKGDVRYNDLFSQHGEVSIIIHRTADYQPIAPWNFE